MWYGLLWIWDKTFCKYRKCACPVDWFWKKIVAIDLYNGNIILEKNYPQYSMNYYQIKMNTTFVLFVN